MPKNYELPSRLGILHDFSKFEHFSYKNIHWMQHNGWNVLYSVHNLTRLWSKDAHISFLYSVQQLEKWFKNIHLENESNILHALIRIAKTITTVIS